MNLMELIQTSGGGSVVQQMATRFGLEEGETRDAMAAMLPALTRGLQRNAQASGGLEALLAALAGGRHDRYLDRPDTLGEAGADEDGRAILGHVFGSKDVSRNVAGRAAAETGIDGSVLRRMLPVLAAVAMGALSKRAQQRSALGGGLSSGSGADSPLGSLGALLDADRDGSVMDDVLDLARRFF